MGKSSTRPDGGAFLKVWQSPWTRWVGRRYLRSKKNSRFLSFITSVSIIGVGLGVTAMVVVLSVMDGFELELRKRLLTSDLHVLIEPEAGQKLPEGAWETLKAKHPEVQAIWPIIAAEGILKSGRRVTGVVMKGVDAARLDVLRTKLVETGDSQLTSQKDADGGPKLPEAYVGQELAYEMGLIPGDQLTLVSPTEMEGPLGNIPRMKRFVVGGVYRGGGPEQELHTVFASDQAVRSFLRKPDAVSSWELTVSNIERSQEVAASFRAIAPGLRVKDWIDLNAQLFASLKLERIAMAIVLAFTIIVASFNIVTTLTLMVLEKRKEISILKAMGATNGEVGAIFLSEGLLIGLTGVVGGICLSFFICLALRRYEFITLPEIYYDRTLPVTFNPSYYLMIALSALVIVLIAAIYPSRRAAALSPLEGIRFGS